MDTKLRTQALGVSLSFTLGTIVQLILYSGMLNQILNWIIRELVFLLVLVVPALSSYTLFAWVMRVELALSLLLCIKAFW